MPKAPVIEELLKGGSSEWNKLRKTGRVTTDHTGATFQQLFSANTDLSGLALIGSEWERCDLSKVSFRDTDLSNAYFHGGRLQDCDFRGANLEGATFEKLKLLRCDFSGAKGLEELEIDDVDMDRVVGLDGEEAPPPPPPPAVGVTSFTREQRTANQGGQPGEDNGEPPPFRPHDPPGTLLFRGIQRLIVPPAWALDAPGLRPPLPARGPAGSALEGLLRDAVQTRLEGRRPVTDPQAVERAQAALRLGGKDAAFAAMYLREVGAEPHFRFSAEASLKKQLRAEIDVDDATASIDPRVTGALLELRLPLETEDALGEAKRRLAAAHLFSALLEAGFTPENNWEEALESQDASMDLATVAFGTARDQLTEAFGAFAGLPEEARLRRLAYLSEAASHLEALGRLPPDVQPRWISGPESREHHDREMTFIQVLKANQVAGALPELAKSELGIGPGETPEDSDNDLFVHVRCAVCNIDKLIVQSA
ncbi:MAG: pentapeptide repeat-containing protein [Myxococcaceae bacterium]